MKNKMLVILGIVIAGVMVASAQLVDAPDAATPERRLRIAEFADTSAVAAEQGAKFAAAADYLRLALVLGLGMLIGRMSAVSYRELTETKAT